MPTLHFTTPYGAHYKVNEHGQIYGGPNEVKPSNGWKFLGLARTGPGFAFGKLACWFSSLTPELVRATQWLYTTSRNPRFTVIDEDHGTRRTWGNTKAHGINSMWYED